MIIWISRPLIAIWNCIKLLIGSVAGGQGSWPPHFLTNPCSKRSRYSNRIFTYSNRTVESSWVTARYSINIHGTKLSRLLWFIANPRVFFCELCVERCSLYWWQGTVQPQNFPPMQTKQYNCKIFVHEYYTVYSYSVLVHIY